MFAAVASAQPGLLELGSIDFFGYAGIDMEEVRRTLPYSESELPVTINSASELNRSIEASVRRAVGTPPTDMAVVCCNDAGQWMLYIGLPGRSSRVLAYRASPKGSARLPSGAIVLADQEEAAWREAVRQGVLGEDDSRGYPLAEYPELRARQLEIRSLALRSDDRLYRVLQDSSDARHRAIAAHMIGFARQSKRQFHALVRASRDADEDVRNNSVRALGVLVSARSELARSMPLGTFVEHLSSGRWTDRNKAASLLERLSRSRDQELLGRLRSEVIPALIEMARWHWPGHSSTSRLLLGRIAGIE